MEKSQKLFFEMIDTVGHEEPIAYLTIQTTPKGRETVIGRDSGPTLGFHIYPYDFETDFARIQAVVDDYMENHKWD